MKEVSQDVKNMFVKVEKQIESLQQSFIAASFERQALLDKLIHKANIPLKLIKVNNHTLNPNYADLIKIC